MATEEELRSPFTLREWLSFGAVVFVPGSRRGEGDAMRLSKHQQIAYDNPCFEASDTLNERFYWTQEVTGLRVVIGLTANSGLE